jgi:hypothetical protein
MTAYPPEIYLDVPIPSLYIGRHRLTAEDDVSLMK